MARLQLSAANFSAISAPRPLQILTDPCELQTTPHGPLDDLGLLPRCSCNQYISALEVVRHFCVIASILISCDSADVVTLSEVDVHLHRTPQWTKPCRFPIFILCHSSFLISKEHSRRFPTALTLSERIHRKHNLSYRIILTIVAMVNYVSFFGSS